MKYTPKVILEKNPSYQKKINNNTLQIVKKAFSKEPFKAMSLIAVLISFLIPTFFPIVFPDLVDDNSSYWLITAFTLLTFLGVLIVFISPAIFLYSKLIMKGNIYKLFSPNINLKNNNSNLLLFWLIPNIVFLFFILIVLVYFKYNVPLSVVLLSYPLSMTIILFSFKHYKTIKIIFRNKNKIRIIGKSIFCLIEYFIFI